MMSHQSTHITEPLDFEPNFIAVNVALGQIGAKRVIDMWEHKSAFEAIDCTPKERELLMEIWRTIPNPASCLMTGYWHLYAAAKEELRQQSISRDERDQT